MKRQPNGKFEFTGTGQAFIDVTDLKGFLSTQEDINKAMMWAACCVGFFGFLRTAEFTVPNENFDPSSHLAVKDVAVDCHTASSLLQIQIKMSKNNTNTEPVFKWPLPTLSSAQHQVPATTETILQDSCV